MKKATTSLLTLLLVLGMIFALPFKTTAASNTAEDGLEITISTGKETYTANEEISVFILVKNTNTYAINNASIKTVLPKELVIKSGELNSNNISISAGQTYTAELTMIEMSHKAGETPPTGDRFVICIWCAFLIISILGIALIVKCKQGIKALSILLCIALLTAMMPTGVSAIVENTSTVSVDNVIAVDEKEYTIKTTLTYPLNLGLEGFYKITFDSNGGSNIAPQIIEAGKKASYPNAPSRSGHTFLGWYTDSSFNQLFDFSNEINKSCTLIARWLNTADTTDTDGDGLTNPTEEYYGTNKLKEDTDEDGLNDYIEITVLNLDPLKIDTDGNSISDSEEDSDSDTINNGREIELGTDPAVRDTDGDGLNDNDEINVYNTNPTLKDSDEDGVSDGKEIELGTDPNSAQETFTLDVSAANEHSPVTPSVQIELSGEQVETLNIEPVSNDTFFPRDMPGYLGQAYNFNVSGEFENATISFEFDSSTISQHAEPVICYFNEETQELEELETEIKGNTATATVSHFSTYILVDRKVLADSFTWIDVWKSDVTYTNVEIVLVIDDSGSMEWNDANNQRLAVAKTLIDNLPKNSKVGIVRFASNTNKLTSTITENKEIAKGYLTSSYFHSSGGTYMYNAINSSLSMFESTDSSTLKMMVVLSDGISKGTSNQNTTIINANNQGIKIYTVGLGDSSTYFANYLQPLATNTAGTFYLAANATQLAEIFDNINERIDIETDVDNDGIPDFYEDNMLCFNGVKLALDKNNPDTDGDGLKDGEEIELKYEYSTDKTKVKVTGKLVKGNPVLKDTDGDGFIDGNDVDFSHWNVSYRDLALFSKIAYEDLYVGTDLSNIDNNISVENYGVTGTSKELKGWKVIESVYNPVTGFEAAAYTKDSNIVIATRGSESKDIVDILQDWVLADVLGYLTGLNAQLPALETFMRKVQSQYGSTYDNFYVTGHSLGGYLALMAGSQLVKLGLTDKIGKVVTFNALGMSTSSVPGAVLDADDNINLQIIRDKIKNYKASGDIVSCIGYTPGDDITVDMASSLGEWSVVNAHSLVTFIERFSNSIRKPNYTLPKYHGLNDEL